MSYELSFTKDNIDIYLKELAKELRKYDRSGMPVEIILVGGAAILENYGFRDMTNDIDAVFRSAVSLKDAINRVGDKFNLPNGWINTDFMRTELIVIDEFGFVPLHKETAEMMLRVISECYERNSLIITYNLKFSGWNTALGDNRLTEALIDRLVHSSHIVIFSGESYRLRQSMMMQTAACGA